MREAFVGKKDSGCHEKQDRSLRGHGSRCHFVLRDFMLSYRCAVVAFSFLIFQTLPSADFDYRFYDVGFICNASVHSVLDVVEVKNIRDDAL